MKLGNKTAQILLMGLGLSVFTAQLYMFYNIKETKKYSLKKENNQQEN
jgi:hypothetical protein